MKTFFCHWKEKKNAFFVIENKSFFCHWKDDKKRKREKESFLSLWRAKEKFFLSLKREKESFSCHWKEKKKVFFDIENRKKSVFWHCEEKKKVFIDIVKRKRKKLSLEREKEFFLLLWREKESFFVTVKRKGSLERRVGMIYGLESAWSGVSFVFAMGKSHLCPEYWTTFALKTKKKSEKHIEEIPAISMHWNIKLFHCLHKYGSYMRRKGALKEKMEPFWPKKLSRLDIENNLTQITRNPGSNFSSTSDSTF